MDSRPLPELLEDIIDLPFDEDRMPWDRPQLQTVQIYFSQVEVDVNFLYRMKGKLQRSEPWQDRSKPHMHKSVDQLVLSFLRDLGEIFKVPKRQQLSQIDSTVKESELVAGFIHFLLRLLRHAACGAFSQFPAVVDRVVKELGFLVGILGDGPFQAPDHEQVRSILEEFEQVANEAGALVHSLVFIPDVAVTTTNQALDALLEHIEVLKANIIKFSDSLQIIFLNPRLNAGMDSLFIVGTLIHNLEDLIVVDTDGSASDELNDQFKALHLCLLRYHSSLMLPHSIEVEELKKEPIVVQIVAMANDAEYLISSFLYGTAPLWYLTKRLSSIINKITLDATRLEKIKQDCNITSFEVADDFGAQSPAQAKIDSQCADDIIIGVEQHRENIVLVGFEQQEKHTLDLLVHGKQELEKVFIYGMPGIGKTTLAKRMYCHPKVNCHFDRSAWCVVSQMPKRENLLIDILICIGSNLKEDIKDMNEAALELKIYQILKHRRYLIVIDDIWDSDVWDDFQFLPDDENGSKILLTSRNKDAAPPGSMLHELLLLSNDQCWALLEKKVFHSNPCPPELHEIGKKIAASCHGLPLAVVVVAGILSTVENEQSTWENVRQSLDCYTLSDQCNLIMQTLKLSYKHLPQHLKPCFLYFGVFDEDEKIRVKELIQLWIAEGFICEEENKSVECLAKEYLTELIERSLVTLDDAAKVCSVHDLLRDMCLQIIEKESFLKLTDKDSYSWNQGYFRLCVSQKPVCQLGLYNWAPYGLGTRAEFSFVNKEIWELPDSSVPNGWKASVSVLNKRLLRLRVLNHRINVGSAFPGIEVLVHLRYLAVQEVPKSLHSFLNLEFLVVRGAIFISSRILEMVKLKSIRGDDVFFGASFVDNCDVLPKTSNVKYLSVVCIDNQKDLESLTCFPDLRELKCSLEVSSSLACFDLQFLTQLECLGVSSLHQIGDIKFRPILES